MGSSQMDRTPPDFDVCCSSVLLRPPLPITTVLKPLPSSWLSVPFLIVDSPYFFLHSLQSCHSPPVLVLGSWHISSTLCLLIHFSAFPRAVFLRGFIPEFVLFFWYRTSSSYSVYNNIGGDRHVVTFYIEKRLGLVYKAGCVGGKYYVVRE